jgi:hypothetical protein
MEQSIIKMKLRGYPVSEALRAERWHICVSLSLAFFSRTDNVAIHLWPFTSVSPVNATKYLYICWVSSPQCTFTVALGANDQGPAVEGIVNHLRFLLPRPAKSEFLYIERSRIPWIRFATEIDPNVLAATPAVVPPSPDSELRTVDKMLDFVQALGEGFDEPLSRATALLSAHTNDKAEEEEYFGYCMQIGKLCREREIEAVFWPTPIWQEVSGTAEIFTGTIIPPQYIPAGPELWYTERRIPLEFPQDDPRRQWDLSGFEISSIVLLPTHSIGSDVCLSLLLLQTDMVQSETRDPDEVVPRIMTLGAGVTGKPCCDNYNWIMSGISFMTQRFPRTSHEYTRHEHKMAQKQGRKLQPYSIMEVRKLEPLSADLAPGIEDQTQSHGNFSYGFIQRSHYRRLNQPRKTDGLQVVLVAAGRKCKHLPLKPETKLKVIKVVR